MGAGAWLSDKCGLVASLLARQVWRGERKKDAEEHAGPDEAEYNSIISVVRRYQMSLSQGTKLSFRVAADRVERPPEGGTGPIEWDDIFPEASC